MHLPPATHFRTALGVVLLNLHTTRRLVMVQIEDAKRRSLPTGDLELKLASNKGEYAAFEEFLHASQ